jgi:hypothetical protein
MPKIYSREGLLDTPAYGGSMPSVTLGGEGRMDEAIRNRKWLKRPSGDPANVNIGGRSFKRGGKVKKTGLAKLHKGERVIKASTAKKLTSRKIAAAARKKPAPRTRRG